MEGNRELLCKQKLLDLLRNVVADAADPSALYVLMPMRV
jgi:hypothetical protein